MIQYLTIIQKAFWRNFLDTLFRYRVTDCNSFDSYTQDEVNFTFWTYYISWSLYMYNRKTNSKENKNYTKTSTNVFATNPVILVYICF